MKKFMRGRKQGGESGGEIKVLVVKINSSNLAKSASDRHFIPAQNIIFVRVFQTFASFFYHFYFTTYLTYMFLKSPS